MAPSTRRYKSLHGNASKLLQRKTRSLAPGKGSAKKRDYDTAEPKSDENSGDNENNAPGPVVKKAKQGNKGTRIQAPGSPNQSKSASDVNTNKAQDIMSKYRTLPLFDMNLLKPTKATSETVLAFVLEAMLISACISHKLAYKSVKCLIEVGYYDARTQKKSSWEKRTEVLTKGGYTSYHEKTATTLGRLAEFVLNEYDSPPFEVRDMIKGIEEISKVSTYIFFDIAQGVWPNHAAFINPRSFKSAKQCGIGSDVDDLWQ